MALRHQLLFVLVGVLPSMGASYRTTNFVVDAPTAQIAQQVGQAAEHYRKEKAQLWLGHDMPPWPEACPLKVKVTMGGAGGATSFAFDRGRVLGQQMNIEGSLDRLLASVLPHEVTHTVFAQYFRTPVPRWADEGGAVLSEDDIEKERHDKLVRQILNTPGRAMPLRRLFGLRDYPGDVMVLYAEGFSVTQFLVERSSRPTFLAFVANGMHEGWDHAVRTHYRYNSVEELEQAWLAHLRSTKRQPPAQLARNTNQQDSNNRVVVRQTVPPAQPLLSAPVPIVRGQTGERDDDRFGNPADAATKPEYLPGFQTQAAGSRPPVTEGLPPVPAAYAPNTAPRDPWQPPASSHAHPASNQAAPAIRLGPPQALENPKPGPVAPVGYPQ